jgi:hypothetical protein
MLTFFTWQNRNVKTDNKKYIFSNPITRTIP